MYTKLDELLKTCDAVLLTSPHNMRYFSGFSGGEGAVLITSNEKTLYTDSRYTEAAQFEAKAFKVVETNNWLGELKNFDSILFEDEEVSAADYAKLKKASPKTEFISGSAELKKLRMVKTNAELEKIAEAEALACRAFEYVLGIIKPDLFEYELAAELEYYMKKNGGEGTSFETIAISGARTSLPHGVPTGKRIEKGDFVTMDFGCKVRGYCADMTRTVVVGKASDEQRKIYNIVKTAQQAGLEFIREGVTGKDADLVARKVIENAGYGEYFRHSLGHGVGLLVHEMPNLSPKSEIELKTNMVVSCEPGIYIPDFGGVRIEDLVIVKADGNINLTPATKELIEI